VFKPGDKALFKVYKGGNKCSDGWEADPYNNTVVVVETDKLYDGRYIGGFGYGVTFNDGYKRKVGAVCLFPLPPERQETVNWNDVVWQPARETA
jgi:hypothetical protein